MITSIFEFYFSKHYISEPDNRFETRIKNVKILNNLADNNKAQIRLKRILYWYGLELLDKSATAIMPIAILFGNIYFKDNGKLIPAILEIDNDKKGNVYVAIIKDNEVVTIMLYPIETTNGDIIKNIQAHDNTIVKKIIDGDLKELNLNDNKRKSIVIDLDISDNEFNIANPKPKLKNNSISLLSKIDQDWLNEIENIEIPKFASHAIPEEYKKLIPNKEFVIYEGMKILVSYPDGPKEKTIKKLIIDEKSGSRKFSLEFVNTAKPLELNLGTQFIIKPVINNDTYKQLLLSFRLDNKELSFQGPITKFNFYSKEKTKSIPKLGVIIEPRLFF